MKWNEKIKNAEENAEKGGLLQALDNVNKYRCHRAGYGVPQDLNENHHVAQKFQGVVLKGYNQ